MIRKRKGVIHSEQGGVREHEKLGLGGDGQGRERVWSTAREAGTEK